MLTYIYVYVASFTLSIFSILAKNKFFTLTSVYFLFFVILMFVGLRHNIGSDWKSYNEYYFFSWEEKNNTIFEMGFSAISHFFYSAGIEFNYFVFFITLVALLPILRLSRKYKYGIVIFFLYFTVYLIPLMGLMRQMIAVSLCLIAAEKLYQKKNRQYFIYVVTAMFFHVGAVLFFLTYFVQKINTINIRAIFFILMAIIIFNYLIVEQVGYYLIHNNIMSHEVKVYFSLLEYNQNPPYNHSDLSTTMIMITRKIVFLIVFLYYFTKISYSHKGLFYLKIYSLALMMNLIFYSSLPVLAVRGAIYFSIFEIVLLALLCEHTRYKWLFIFTILLYGGVKYFQIMFESSQKLVPYKSIFSLY